MEQEHKVLATDNLENGGPRPKRPTKVKNQVFITVVFATSVLAGLAGGFWGSMLYNQSAPTITERQVILDESRIISEVAEKIGPSVVSVNVTSVAGEGLFGPRSQESSGTGFIINEEGIVITNRHVIPGDDPQVSLTLSDGTELDDVELIGRTGEGDNLDVAFLKINDTKGSDLQPVELGDSAGVKIGDRVIAVGNALGQFQNTVTFGIISGFGRDVDARDSNSQRVDSLQNLFQTDAAINPGNSGGPLVNIDGEVIGINTAVAGGAQNIGFAIPINDVSGLIASVLEDGEFQRPFLGVMYVTLTDDLAFEYDLDVKRGAYILPSSETGEPGIVPNSPAEKAGLTEGDVITKVNDKEIDERNSLVSLLRQYKVGEEIELSVVRNGDNITLTTTLVSAPED